jgi:hypothetical protein
MSDSVRQKRLQPYLSENTRGRERKDVAPNDAGSLRVRALHCIAVGRVCYSRVRGLGRR